MMALMSSASKPSAAAPASTAASESDPLSMSVSELISEADPASLTAEVGRTAFLPASWSEPLASSCSKRASSSSIRCSMAFL